MADIQHDDAAREAYTSAIHDCKDEQAVTAAQTADTGNRMERDRDVINDPHDRFDQIQKVWE